jgi:hypothetical protein
MRSANCRLQQSKSPPMTSFHFGVVAERGCSIAIGVPPVNGGVNQV